MRVLTYTERLLSDAVTELAKRIDALETRVEDQDALIEELRYAGPVTSRSLDPYDPDDLIAEEWEL